MRYRVQYIHKVLLSVFVLIFIGAFQGHAANKPVQDDADVLFNKAHNDTEGVTQQPITGSGIVDLESGFGSSTQSITGSILFAQADQPDTNTGEDSAEDTPAETGAIPDLSPQPIKYKTSHFFLHSGAVILNPYTIKKNDEGKFMLEESGETDTNFFMEALYRNRYAWLGKTSDDYTAMDYEMRIGYAGVDSDSSGAVVSGAGDAYMEYSIGILSPLRDLKAMNADDASYSCNLEILAGFVTDKGAQDLHFYWGIGPAVAVGVPYSGDANTNNKRRIEIIGGIYFGHTDKPEFADDDTREIESQNDLPEFKLKQSAIWRGDIHFPIGENGFLTFRGRFVSNLEDEGINPWNLALGYTLPVDVFTNSISSIVKQ